MNSKFAVLMCIFFILKDSMVDLVNGLGVPLEKMLLGVPTAGLVFTLADKNNTVARAPALSPPIHATYSQATDFPV